MNIDSNVEECRLRGALLLFAVALLAGCGPDEDAFLGLWRGTVTENGSSSTAVVDIDANEGSYGDQGDIVFTPQLVSDIGTEIDAGSGMCSYYATLVDDTHFDASVTDCSNGHGSTLSSYSGEGTLTGNGSALQIRLAGNFATGEGYLFREFDFRLTHESE